MNGMNGQIPLRTPRRFVSLRTKLIGFISLIIIAVCSGLSWYFLQTRAELMNDVLVEKGVILAKNLAYNGRYNLFIENILDLTKLIDGVMDVEEVVYVVISGPERKILIAKSKGMLAGGELDRRTLTVPLYPDAAFAGAVFEAGSVEPQVTPFVAVKESTQKVKVMRGRGGVAFIPT